MKRVLFILLLTVSLLLSLASCEEQKEHTAPAIYPRDSVAVMISYGVNTLISDSGVIKYRIVTEKWEVNQNRNPQRWIFDKGLFLEQFDEKFHVQSFIQCDTAYYYNENRLWELRGRVHILTKDGLRFNSEQLFWDEREHQLYSHVFSKLITPERQLQGSYFRSDEKMTKYYVSNTQGSFEKGDIDSGGDTLTTAADTVKAAVRPQTPPRRRNTSIPLTH
ncbi:LPS export ABC transporter periplasmic protein LptC [Prevotella sp. kh1p2]|uniref:LPS export ABC transporter periplasmic protein LptC n=1 Tax=Prevotella sp. kh1p2 TaxID=1761883 RepID=UPI0008CD1C5F|nr:LPS export ABC transporter periplasmic protein LptC [Prevotella sp. kh1p2]SET14643.1 LPS export ABC transporter protein LptC [Prevotella sp. kh1p2]SNU11982.1 LPS export ABC transporter protein LptC [Prevotellaceae bacterium KH2P17]